jgi:hypothetical protein
MSLPVVSGWIIDFRTAEAIFSSASNTRIDHCVELCQKGEMHISHKEKSRFKSAPNLKACFVDGQNCTCVPDAAVMSACLALSESPLAKRLATGNDTALFIAATAATMDFGVLSDHRSPYFATVYDLCVHVGIPVFSADEYFNLL